MKEESGRERVPRGAEELVREDTHTEHPLEETASHDHSSTVTREGERVCETKRAHSLTLTHSLTHTRLKQLEGVNKGHSVTVVFLRRAKRERVIYSKPPPSSLPYATQMTPFPTEPNEPNERDMALSIRAHSS